MRKEFITINDMECKRVSKKTAEKAYNAGQRVFVYPVNANMYHDMWKNHGISKEDGEGDFNKICNEILFYSCTPETGKYLKFFVSDKFEVIPEYLYGVAYIATGEEIFLLTEYDDEDEKDFDEYKYVCTMIPNKKYSSVFAFNEIFMFDIYKAGDGKYFVGQRVNDRMYDISYDVKQIIEDYNSATR